MRRERYEKIGLEKVGQESAQVIALALLFVNLFTFAITPNFPLSLSVRANLLVISIFALSAFFLVLDFLGIPDKSVKNKKIFRRLHMGASECFFLRELFSRFWRQPPSA